MLLRLLFGGTHEVEVGKGGPFEGHFSYPVGKGRCEAWGRQWEETSGCRICLDDRIDSLRLPWIDWSLRRERMENNARILMWVIRWLQVTFTELEQMRPGPFQEERCK